MTTAMQEKNGLEISKELIQLGKHPHKSRKARCCEKHNSPGIRYRDIQKDTKVNGELVCEWLRCIDPHLGLQSLAIYTSRGNRRFCLKATRLLFHLPSCIFQNIPGSLLIQHFLPIDQRENILVLGIFILRYKYLFLGGTSETILPL